jgi:hypothetical protein
MVFDPPGAAVAANRNRRVFANKATREREKDTKQ